MTFVTHTHTHTLPIDDTLLAAQCNRWRKTIVSTTFPPSGLLIALCYLSYSFVCCEITLVGAGVLIGILMSRTQIAIVSRQQSCGYFALICHFFFFFTHLSQTPYSALLLNQMNFMKCDAVTIPGIPRNIHCDTFSHSIVCLFSAVQNWKLN